MTKHDTRRAARRLAEAGREAAWRELRPLLVGGAIVCVWVIFETVKGAL